VSPYGLIFIRNYLLTYMSYKIFYGVAVTGVHAPEGVTACEDIVLGFVVVTCPAPGKAPFNSTVPDAGN
jgi:hypothetical protein